MESLVIPAVKGFQSKYWYLEGLFNVYYIKKLINWRSLPPISLFLNKTVVPSFIKCLW